MRSIILILITVFTTSCAATYKQPTIVAPETSMVIAGSRADVMRVAKQILVAEGFQITAIDDVAGIISTAPRNLRVTPAQADCGTTMGIDYLNDKRTATRVAFGVVVLDGKVIVKATIEGEYKPGAVDQDITLTCVSRGVLEENILAKIIAGINR